MIRVRDATVQQNVIILLPGEHYVSDHEVLTTIVGSCYVVCMYDPIKKIGGMTHCLLPVLSALQMKQDEIWDYNITMLERFIGSFVKRGSDRKNCIMKVFGGSGVSPNIKQTYNFLEDYCRNENIQLDAIDVGGNYRRKIYFYCNSGKVHRYVVDSSGEVSEFVKMEREYIETVLNNKVDYGNIILFE